ncbi:hypothetical protein M8J77_004290 [Diaphorina citri]|nr:hypothetical protein M8J77_004290 [Diaphorina citri]
MAFAGLKKQLNKANQYMTEKMGGAEGTKLDVDFVDMERKTDVTYELVEELQMKTKEYLQPNPTARAKMAAVKGISKLSGQAKASTYPQPEGTLGECMSLYGKKLGDDSIFGQALLEMGESLKQMADVKYSLDDNTKQNFLEPLHHLQMKDLKEVMHHRKKLQGRRLDYDCKRRRQAKGSQITDDELKAAEEKFAESLHLAQMGMFNLLENDVEQISQLVVFSEGLLEYHQQCTEILKMAVETLREKREEATMRPKSEFIPKKLDDLVHLEPHEDNMNGALSTFHLPTPRPKSVPVTSSSEFSHKSNFSHRDFSHKNTFSSGKNGTHSHTFQSLMDISPPSTVAPALPSFTPTFTTHMPAPTPSLAGNGNFDPFDPWAIPTPPVKGGGSQAGSPTHHNKPDHLELSLDHGPGRSNNASPLPSPVRQGRTPVVNKAPCCTALYDFEPENPGELGFKEGDTITLMNRVDENWYEGSLNGRTGYFPVTYVQVVVPLP